MSDVAAPDIPRRRIGVELRRDGDHCLLLDEAGVELCAMNDTAAAIWELCDGRTTVSEMASAVSVIAGITPATAERDIWKVVGKLARTGALEWVDAG
jgi:hypothetical protein